MIYLVAANADGTFHVSGAANMGPYDGEATALEAAIDAASLFARAGHVTEVQVHRGNRYETVCVYGRSVPLDETG
jgi:hypothetical protein